MCSSNYMPTSPGQPVLSELIECDASRSYALDAFSRFHKPSATTKRQRNIDAMPLPAIRKSTAAKTDKLSECIAASTIAREGARSETDFALCCYAIRNGFEAEEVWQRVESVGKFAEAGRPYFDRTWANAQHDVRTSLYDKLERRVEKATERPTIDTDAFSEPDSDTQPKITVDPKETPVATTMEEITSRLAASNCCYTRVNQLVVVNGESISPILSPAELTGLLNQYAEFFFIKKEMGEYKPLPTSYANTWLNNSHQRNRLPAIKLFSRKRCRSANHGAQTTIAANRCRPAHARVRVWSARERQLAPARHFDHADVQGSAASSTCCHRRVRIRRRAIQITQRRCQEDYRLTLERQQVF